jgi:hypothetical protein
MKSSGVQVNDLCDSLCAASVRRRMHTGLTDVMADFVLLLYRLEARTEIVTHRSFLRLRTAEENLTQLPGTNIARSVFAIHILFKLHWRRKISVSSSCRLQGLYL